MTWNRLTNLDRKELCKLPVWTTEADRRRALSYVDHPLEGTFETIRALSTGAPAPKNLGLLVAVARYEDAGWMPDGCFEKWRRWERNGYEQLNVAALVQWLDTYESTMASKLRDLETHLMNQCRQQEQELAMVQSGATLAQQRLHTHREGQILARLSIGDLHGAVQIAQRVPAGPARNEIDKILRAHSALPNTTTAQADLCTEEREALAGLKQLLESAAYHAHKDGPVLVALVDRLLKAAW